MLIEENWIRSLQVYLWQGNAFGPNVECPKPGSLHQKTLTKLTWVSFVMCTSLPNVPCAITSGSADLAPRDEGPWTPTICPGCCELSLHLRVQNSGCRKWQGWAVISEIYEMRERGFVRPTTPANRIERCTRWTAQIFVRSSSAKRLLYEGMVRRHPLEFPLGNLFTCLPSIRESTASTVTGAQPAKSLLENLDFDAVSRASPFPWGCLRTSIYNIQFSL